MPEDRPSIAYPFRSPRMDQSVPPNEVPPGSCGLLSGVDGRFNGCLRKYYGNESVVDLDGVAGLGGIDTYNGVDFFKQVTFQKTDTSTTYRGFVIRWDSQNDTTNEQIDLVYTEDNGSSWSTLTIWAAGNGITSSLEIDCEVKDNFLLVAVDTKATQTVYYNGSSLVAVTSGPGAFSETLAATTLSTTSVDTSYQLNGSGTYQVAWRFYSSDRGIYSALSNPLTIRLDHLKTTKALGTISFSAEGGDSGLLIDGDVITINGRTYEADDDSTFTGDVQVDISGLSTISDMCQALSDAINGDSSADVTASTQATSVLVEAKTRGTVGNAYALSKTEIGANQDDISVSGSTLTGGGVVTGDPETQCKAVIDFPAHGSVVSGSDFDDFDALFDTVDIFRTIDLGDSFTSQGAIFYLEQTISKTGNWATSGTWDSLQASIGTLVDEALPFQTKYDPEKDIVVSPPQSGTIGRYEDQTYMAQAASSDGGFDTLFSSAEHSSPEYFSTYNTRKGQPRDGRPLRFLEAGDSLFQLNYNSIVSIFKSGKLKPIQFNTLHRRRGLIGKEAAHSSGNSIFMIAGMGLSVLNGADGSMGGLAAADRLIFIDWASNLANIKSGYDARLNASFFLNSSAEEVLILWHSTRTVSMLHGANFVGITSGPAIDDGGVDRVHMVTATGLVVRPDVSESGSGTMWDLSSSYTLNGTATGGGSSLVDENATFHADMIGAKLYFVTGDNAGEARTIDTVDVGNTTLTFTSDFDNDISTGDIYSISPVPFMVRAWRVQDERIDPFNRWVISGVAVKSRAHSGFDSNPANVWRIGGYRNSSSSIESTTAFPDVSQNPSDSAEALALDGVDLEPYIEQLASGVMFELTDMKLILSLTDSNLTSDS